MKKIKIEIDLALFNELKKVLKETFEAEKRERKVLAKRIRTAYLINEKASPGEIIEIALRDYIKILKRLYFN